GTSARAQRRRFSGLPHFLRQGNPSCPCNRLRGEGMSELAVGTTTRKLALDGAVTSNEDFIQAFNEVRAELVSTLFFVLGNHEDAQDAAQDAFLKCWRSRTGLGEVRNVRAWIFRVGLNAAKDLQRSAWRRRAKPLTTMTADQTTEGSPVESLEDKES